MTRSLALAGLTAACAGLRPAETSVRAVDEDGDGRADRFELVTGGIVERVTHAPAPGTDPERTLVLAIDGIPYDVFAHEQAEGRFAAFFPASRMLAPFPSLTDVSFTALLRTPPSMAYEDKYYDRATGEVKGGLSERVGGDYRSLAPFHDVFDWEQPVTWGGLRVSGPVPRS